MQESSIVEVFIHLRKPPLLGAEKKKPAKNPQNGAAKEH